jgi:hypothetical protein
METKQFKVGQVWRARGGWEYPPIKRVFNGLAYITENTESGSDGFCTAPSLAGRQNVHAQTIFDLHELVQDAPEPKPKTHRPLTEADMPAWDRVIVTRLKTLPRIRRQVVVICDTCVGLGVGEFADWNQLAEKYEYTIDGGKT